MSKRSASNPANPSGGYRPELPFPLAPVFEWPPRLWALLKWLPSYLWPWQALFFAIAAGCWVLLSPAPAELKNWSAHWVSMLFIRNGLVVIAFVATWHFWLYVRKSQGTEYKYSNKWLAVDDPTFLFRDQLWDNVFWTVCSAVPILTAYEAVTLWLHSNHYVPAVAWDTNPVYCTLLAAVLSLWIQIHFFATHRLLHWQPLYRSVHYIHHKNVNVGPWSGLAMHPMEHLLLFSAVVLLWVIPSHPVHGLFVLMYLALSPTVSHSGFNRVKLGRGVVVGAADYMHHLHHKHVRVNFGGSLVPLDKWLGSLHDGSEEAEKAMKRRARERASRLLGKG